jgi:hypothetical protein
MQKICFQGLEDSGRLFRHGRRKKAIARTSCCNIHNATTPVTIELTTAETLASAWMHQHGCQQQQKGEDLGRYVENKLLKLRVLYQRIGGTEIQQKIQLKYVRIESAHPVWVAEINVTACNSVTQSALYINYCPGRPPHSKVREPYGAFCKTTFFRRFSGCSSFFRLLLVNAAVFRPVGNTGSFSYLKMIVSLPAFQRNGHKFPWNTLSFSKYISNVAFFPPFLCTWRS